MAANLRIVKMSQRSQRYLSQRNSQSNTTLRNSQLDSGEASQRSKSNDLNDEQVDAAVLRVTHFLLSDLQHQRKIKKDDIVVNALNKSSKQYSVIMKRVDHNLLTIFGFKIVGLANNYDNFIVVNTQKAKFNELTLDLCSEEDIQDNMILTMALASIFMNRGQMYQSHLLRIFEVVGFLSDKFYGNACTRKMKEHVTQLIKQLFVKQMYLEATIVNRPERVQDPPLPENENKVTVLQWGIRALIEIDVDAIKVYLQEMYDNEKPTGFPVSYYSELKARQQTLRAESNIR